MRTFPDSPLHLDARSAACLSVCACVLPPRNVEQLRHGFPRERRWEDPRNHDTATQPLPCLSYLLGNHLSASLLFNSDVHGPARSVSTTYTKRNSQGGGLPGKTSDVHGLVGPVRSPNTKVIRDLRSQYKFRIRIRPRERERKPSTQ